MTRLLHNLWANRKERRCPRPEVVDPDGTTTRTTMVVMDVMIRLTQLFHLKLYGLKFLMAGLSQNLICYYPEQ